MTVTATTSYADLQGLSSLREQARSTPGEAIEEVAAQFESIFFQMMLKSMRDATIEGDLFSSDQLQMYQQMFDQELSLDLSRKGGLGLAEILVEQLSGPGRQESARDETQINTPSAARLDVERQRGISTPAVGTPLSAAQAPPPAPVSPTAADWNPASPEEFVRQIWQDAVEAAGQLGADPAVLVAQSALETGWGRKMVQTAAGGNSFNLFGIKADSRWQGESAAVSTLEFRDGVAARERAEFRAYPSPARSFSDYVEFLQSSPRYQRALENAGDSQAFVRELQSAGYATDPAYADKIMAILEGGDYKNVVNALKNSEEMPISV